MTTIPQVRPDDVAAAETRSANRCDAVITGLRRAGYTLKFI